jgi:two-component system nitrogen regulation response regulator NtrX
MSHDILVIDDEADIRDLIGGILEDEGYGVRAAGDADSALEAIRARRPALCVLDIWLQGSRMDGLELLSVIRSIDADLPVIIISGHGTIETAVAAIHKGAFDFVEKPFKADRLILIIQRALETARLRRELDLLRLQSTGAEEFIGQSQAAAQLLAAIERVAATNSRVLISGPAGAGKEVAARMVHQRSARSEGPFVALNAAAIAPERMEAELFGEETPDGRPLKIGALERAHNGTLLLDEVSDMPLETQSKVLRVLVEQRFRRLGGGRDVQVNVRIISATARDLRDSIGEGRFREDLFHRLNVVPLRVPALAERRDDIPLFVAHFARRIAEANGIAARLIAPDAVAALQAAEWPGNVRQLRNMIERILILAAGEPSQAVTAEHLPLDPQGLSALAEKTSLTHLLALPLRDARELFEREYLAAQITRFGGNISRTATFIGMERSALHRKLKSLGVDGGRLLDMEN